MINLYLTVPAVLSKISHCAGKSLKTETLTTGLQENC